MSRMRALVIVLCLCFTLGLCTAQNEMCSPTEPLQNLTKMEGVWYEYIKSPSFLGNNTCILFDMTCTNPTSCQVHEMNFETNDTSNKTYNLTLNQTDGKISWEKQMMDIVWIEDFAFVVIAECGTEKEELAVFTKNITLNEASQTGIDAFIKLWNSTTSLNLTLVDNSVCNNAVMTNATVFLLFSLILNAIS